MTPWSLETALSPASLPGVSFIGSSQEYGKKQNRPF
jgi:hypothetical protein